MPNESGKLLDWLRLSLQNLGLWGKMMVLGVMVYKFGEAGIAMMEGAGLTHQQLRKARNDLAMAKEIIKQMRNILESSQPEEVINEIRSKFLALVLASDDPMVYAKALQMYDRLVRRGKETAVQVNVLQQIPQRYRTLTGEVVELPSLPEGEGND